MELYIYFLTKYRMRLGTILAIIVVLAGCGIMGQQALRVDSRSEIEQARIKMQEAEKSARVTRHYPAAPAPTPSTTDNEPKGGSGGFKHSEKSKEVKTEPITKQLFTAALAFVIPDSANINDSIKAQLLIDPKKEAEGLKGQLTKKGTVTANEIKVSKVVKAAIIAPEFIVTNITEEEQILSDTEPTEWLWSLEPKKAGSHDINLTVTAIITSNGRESKHHIKTFEKTVTVEITTQQVILSWIQKYWQWLISTLLLPFGIWLYKKKFG